MMAMLVLGSLAAGCLQGLYAQQQRKKEVQETYTRPKPKEPIKPEIPGVNRYQDDKVFLEYADSLFRPPNEFEEFQIVKGSVKFRQGGMWMFCDSAYYYPEKNAMNAYGNVRMEQGDTLFVFADRLYYDGTVKHATLVRGPSRNQVELKNRDVTLTTDSLDYDLGTEIGWYTTGGKLEDQVNTLTSIYGEYSPATKLAKFRDDVLLVNNKDGYRMVTEELDYNTDTHIATINTKTIIEGANDTIETTQGWYDTTTDHAQLTARSLITHKDSVNNVTWLEGDSIIYDKGTRISRAFMFRDPNKVQQPMVITDTARKVQLIGGYGEFNDSTQFAFATEYPLLIEFSRPDSLFLRADTVLSFMRTEMVWPDSLMHAWSQATRERLRSYANVVELAQSSPEGFSLIPAIPLPGHGLAEMEEARRERERANEELELVDAEEIMEVPGAPGKEHGGEAQPDKAEGRPNETGKSGEAGAALPSDSLMAPVPKSRIDKLGRDSADMVPKEFHVAKAVGKARFFNQDIQGIADTMIFYEYDSLLHLIRKPIVWSGERQVMGNRIDVHFNDSTPDWALLPSSGLMAEHVDEDFYNQISGKVMKAWLEDQKVKKVDVEGNVQIIFLPQESDSTYNKVVNAEGSYLTMNFNEGELNHLRLWPEVNGTVTPVGQVKRNLQFLEGFRWLEALRPQRKWYGDRARWIDELGELPEAVEQWFLEPEALKPEPPNPEEYKKMMRK